MVQASLKTTDSTEAQRRHAIADAAFRRFWGGHRHGPKRLTHKEASALATSVALPSFTLGRR